MDANEDYDTETTASGMKNMFGCRAEEMAQACSPQ